MFQTIFLNAYLKIYFYFDFFWKLLFAWLGKIVLIYHVNNNNIKNITWKYYFGYGLEKHKIGIFYIRIYDIGGMNHIAYYGDITNLQRLELSKFDETPPKRKNIILLNNGIPINIDLDILDNYKKNMKYFNDSSITNLGKILSLMGLNCSHVIIIQTIPFNKIIESVHNIDINYLYY